MHCTQSLKWATVFQSYMFVFKSEKYAVELF